MAKRRNFTDQFKAKVALEALRGDKTVQEIAAKHQLHPNQVSTWKRQAIEGLADVFSGGKQSGPPEIMNTDQGSQFTGSAWITTLTEAGVCISMDGRGRYLDNIFIERLWRSLKQEAIYLEEITDGFQARRVVKDWMTFYNTERPHAALDRQTPDDVYWTTLEERHAA